MSVRFREVRADIAVSSRPAVVLPLSDRSVVLLNPNARGGGAVRLAGEIQSWLRMQRADVSLWVPDSAAAAQEVLLGLPAGSRVVLVGGDGTLNQMLPALLAGQHRLGVVAMGSGNDFARAHGLPCRDWRRGLEAAFGQVERLVDLGELRCGDRTIPFLSSLAAGFDAAVAVRALQGPRWLSGLPRYLWATLSELAFLRNYRMRIVADNEGAFDGLMLFASALNTRSYGGGMPAVPHARTDDGALDLLLAHGFGRVGVLTMLPRLLAGSHLLHPRVAASVFSSLIVECRDSVPLAVDGESVGEWKSWSVRVLAGRLRLIAPCAGAWESKFDADGSVRR